MKKARIEKLLHHVIANYIRQHISLVSTDVLMDITCIQVTPSLRISKVFVNLLGIEPSNQAAFLHKVMREHHWRIKKYVAEKLGKRLRRVPEEIRFFLDDTPDYGVALAGMLDPGLSGR